MKILSGVFLPIIMHNLGAQRTIGGVLTSSSSGRQNEVLGNLQKFAGQVAHTINQLTGDIHLEVCIARANEQNSLILLMNNHDRWFSIDLS